MRSILKNVGVPILVALTLSTPALADPIENLERERARLVETFLDPGLQPEDRYKKIQSAKPRLIDLERMVLRDDSLIGRNTPTVRRAFANYDLTFMVHASAENRRSLIETWLSQVGVSTESIMASRKSEF